MQANTKLQRSRLTCRHQLLPPGRAWGRCSRAAHPTHSDSRRCWRTTPRCQICSAPEVLSLRTVSGRQTRMHLSIERSDGFESRPSTISCRWRGYGPVLTSRGAASVRSTRVSGHLRYSTRCISSGCRKFSWSISLGAGATAEHTIFPSYSTSLYGELLDPSHRCGS